MLYHEESMSSSKVCLASVSSSTNQPGHPCDVVLSSFNLARASFNLLTASRQLSVKSERWRFDSGWGGGGEIKILIKLTNQLHLLIFNAYCNITYCFLPLGKTVQKDKGENRKEGRSWEE